MAGFRPQVSVLRYQNTEVRTQNSDIRDQKQGHLRFEVTTNNTKDTKGFFGRMNEILETMKNMKAMKVRTQGANRRTLRVLSDPLRPAVL